MKRMTLGHIGLAAHLILAGVPAEWLFTSKAAAQSPQAQARSVPVFEVDPAWPYLSRANHRRNAEAGIQRDAADPIAGCRLDLAAF